MREGEDALAEGEKPLNQRQLPEPVYLLPPWAQEHSDDAHARELPAAMRLQLQEWPLRYVPRTRRRPRAPAGTHPYAAAAQCTRANECRARRFPGGGPGQ